MTEMEKKEKSNGSSAAGSGGSAWLMMGATSERSSIAGENWDVYVLPRGDLPLCTTAYLTGAIRRTLTCWQQPLASMAFSRKG